MTLEREDVLISRIVDGAAGDADWRELHELAESDPGVLRRLSEAQRRETALREAVGLELDRSLEAELPEAHSATVHRFRSRLQVWTGWAAAAAVALAWATASGLLDRSPEGGNVAGVGGAMWAAPANSEEALERYQLMGLAEGRVLGELPLVMIQAERRADGATDVTYLRQILERRTVTDVYEPGVDEQGRPALLPARLDALGDEPEAL